MREVENASATRSSPDGRANGVLNSANNMIAVRLLSISSWFPQSTQLMIHNALCLSQAIDRALSKARPSSEEALSSSKDVSEQARAVRSTSMMLSPSMPLPLTLSASSFPRCFGTWPPLWTIQPSKPSSWNAQRSSMIAVCRSAPLILG